MKIALISPPWTKVFGTYSRIGYQASNFPPLGLCYLASLARQRGHRVKVIDAEIEMLGIDQIVNLVSEFSPDLIGISSTTPMFHIASELAEKLKKIVRVPILVGGAHVSYYKEKILNENFDFAFIGESENSFIRFLDCYEKNHDFSSVKGLVFRDSGKSVFTGQAEWVKNLDELPFPARDLLPVKKYTTSTVHHGKKHYTSILMSRGCPFKCVYCCAPELFGYEVRWTSVHKLVNEIEDALNNIGVGHFVFLDSNLTLDRKYMLNLCGEIEKRKLKFTWEGGTRPNLMDEELISAMAKNGLIRISFGLESGDAEVRKIIKKEVSLKKTEEANRLTAKYGVETINSAMLGLPGETREKVWKTVNFIRNAKSIQHATFSIAMPYPGTEFFEMAKKKENGLKLHTEDFAQYQRYGHAVLSVNDMSPNDIIMLQKLGLLRIYSAPFRIKQIIRRFKPHTLILPFVGALLTMFIYLHRNFIKWLKKNVLRKILLINKYN